DEAADIKLSFDDLSVVSSSYLLFQGGFSKRRPCPDFFDEV
ncbi:hypothetical protein A2U01_0086702, partial [Trifolium medium]|nr:hypothetical protein [Trifolium medium]